MLRIWKEIIEGSVNPQIKQSRTDRHRVPKQNLYKYLQRRYTNRATGIIMHSFKFPATLNLNEYCTVIENWICKENKEKIKLGFMLHDMDCDGFISPKDLTDF